MNTTEATDLACQRCGEPATVINQGQPFCDADWAAIRDSWSACLDCGQVFETVGEHFSHRRFGPRMPMPHAERVIETIRTERFDWTSSSVGGTSIERSGRMSTVQPGAAPSRLVLATRLAEAGRVAHANSAGQRRSETWALASAAMLDRRWT